jgi:hypothetical protein
MRGRASLTCALGGICALMLAGIARADAGFQGRAYPGGTSGAPTTPKPESKLWWNDGSWWAIMFRRPGEYRIHRLSKRRQVWRDTGVVVDTRDSTRQDVLSTGNRLFVASHKFVAVSSRNPTPDPTDAMRLIRFGYNAARNRYSRQGMRLINPQRSESLVLARDSTSALWATWVQAGPGAHRVYVKRTVGNCVSGPIARCTWGSTTVDLDGVSPDDISSVIRFRKRIGVMWSDSRAGFIRFAVHRDGAAIRAWSRENVYGGGAKRKRADDHINLKSDASGRVYAVTKTKFRSKAKPGIVLHRRSMRGGWRHFTVSHASRDRTRPIVILEPKQKRIRVFEADTGGGEIHMKTSRMGAISFKRRRAGTTVIADRGSKVNDPTSTKQNVSRRSGIVVLASNHAKKRYWHTHRRVGR